MGVEPKQGTSHRAQVTRHQPEVSADPDALARFRIAYLEAALESRGARVTTVPVYRWALPEDFQVAAMMQQEDAVRAGMRRVVASIGPTTSEALRDESVHIDLEASHPKMGLPVREAAERSPDLLAK